MGRSDSGSATASMAGNGFAQVEDGDMNARRSVLFFVKGAALVGALFLLSRTLPSAPPVVVALALALLGLLGASGIAYGWMSLKTLRQVKYMEDGQLSKLNNGRVLCLVVSFVLAVASAAGLLIESPKWDTVQWALLAVAVPLYYIVWRAVCHFVKKEYAPRFRRAEAMKWTPVVVAGVLSVLFLLVLVFLPPVVYESAEEAFFSVNRPFSESPSSVMVEAEYLGSLKDGFIGYGLSELASSFPLGYCAADVALYALIFFGVANLLSACTLGLAQFVEIVSPLAIGKDQRRPNASSSFGPRGRYVAVAIALPICLVGAFMVADTETGKVVRSGQLTPVQQFVRNQMELSVYVIDNEYLDYHRMQDLLEQAAADSEALAREAHETLVPLINTSFDARIANVDSYLDWYYSLPADYERLGNMVTGTVESYLEDQLREHIEAGIDDSELMETVAQYSERATELERSIEEAASSLELEGLPTWLPVNEVVLEGGFAAKVSEPSHEMLTAAQRFGISGAAGVGSGVVAAKVLEKAVGKQFFSKLVGRVSGAIGSRAAGAAVGGAAGSVLGPVGTVLGVAVGAAAGVGVDALLLNIDEMQNRDSYREELVSAIEEERQAMLDAFEQVHTGVQQTE